MIVKLLTDYHLEFLSLKGGCRGLSESTHVKMPHYWKSHVTAHVIPCLECIAAIHTTVQSLYKAMFGDHRNRPCYK